MKTIHTIFTLIVFAAATTVVTARDYPEEYLGLPGDNLNLYAVMNLFQESETLEKFEQSLNSEEQMINNLDLNGDNLIDYITVSDYVDGNVHNIVLRAALNPKEQQDIAVFVVEQLANGAVQIQLIGDEALYGPNYIVEPIYAETPNPGYTGNSYRSNVHVVTATYYDIAAWPLIRFIFHPGYIAWRSAWYWGYYPTYWRPWRAHYWHYYYGYHYHWHNYYYTHYRHWDHFRCRNYTTYYRNKVRVYSPTVVVNINNNRYRNTYSRPDQRRAGEDYYTRTASNRGNAIRNGVYNGNTRPSANAARVSSASRNSNLRSETARTSQTVNRSSVRPSSRSANSQEWSSAFQQNNRSSAVQRSQPVRSNSVQRSQPANNRSSVQHGNIKKATPSVQRSNSSSNKGSSVQRSQPAKGSSVQHSQPGKSRSSVQHSQPSKSRSSVQHSQPSKSRSSVQHSQPSKSRSSAQPSSSSRKSGASRSSSSGSRR
jgi:hypothetical protein